MRIVLPVFEFEQMKEAASIRGFSLGRANPTKATLLRALI